MCQKYSNESDAFEYTSWQRLLEPSLQNYTETENYLWPNVREKNSRLQNSLYMMLSTLDMWKCEQVLGGQMKALHG